MDLIHADDAILVLDKPAGLPVLPDGWEPEAPYLIQALQAEYGKLWIVHRLDKFTSGVLVVARTPEAHRSLSIQFERHEAIKVYHALCNGDPEWNERTTRAPLRANVGKKHRTVRDDGKGKASQTDFKVVERFRAHVLLEAIPLTGRTHQVRVHAAVVGCPLLGDRLYGAPETELIGRPALHALSLRVQHPVTGETVTFTAPYPEDMQTALQSLRGARR
jgi:RluA family pseudouridine synthase